MTKKMKFNPAQFGMDGKPLAMMDFERFISALKCIQKHGEEHLLVTIRDEFNFKAVPIMFQGEKLSVVEHDKAERAFQYIRENAKPELLAELKAHHEFELMPIKITKSYWRPVAGFMKHAMGIAAALAVVQWFMG